MALRAELEQAREVSCRRIRSLDASVHFFSISTIDSVTSLHSFNTARKSPGGGGGGARGQHQPSHRAGTGGAEGGGWLAEQVCPRLLLGSLLMLKSALQTNPKKHT